MFEVFVGMFFVGLFGYVVARCADELRRLYIESQQPAVR